MRSLLAWLALAATLCAQARDQRTAPVGMRAYLEQIVVPGTELAVTKLDRKAPVALRIVAVWPHGSALRYDFEWTGLEAGTHDLRTWLVRKDGSATSDVPPLLVEAKSQLGKGMHEPSEPDPVPAPFLGGYMLSLLLGGLLWTGGLLLILLLGRKRKVLPATLVARPTLADRLRPLVEAALSQRANTAARAELERVLLAYWRQRLSLLDRPVVEAMALLRQHPEAGALLRQVEQWLHAPQPPKELNLHALLEPYRAPLSGEGQP